MVVKDTYDFDTKKRYREELQRFILQSFPYLSDSNPHRRRKTKDFKVLCLPGHEGLEIPIYKSLGIPARNIHCVERDPDVAHAFKQTTNARGVELYEGTLDAFLRETPHKYDVINFDLQGIFNIEAQKLLVLLYHRNLLKDETIIGTNFLGKRDNAEKIGRAVTELERCKQSIDRLTRDFGIYNMRPAFGDLFFGNVSKGLPTHELRSFLITFSLMSIGEWGARFTKPTSFLEQMLTRYEQDNASCNDPKASKFIQRCRTRYEQLKAESDPVQRFLMAATGVLRDYFNTEPEGFQRYCFEFLDRNYLQLQLSSGLRLLSEDNFPILVVNVAQNLLNKETDSTYLVRAISRGSYIGDKGSRMLYDFLLYSRLNQPEIGITAQDIFDNQRSLTFQEFEELVNTMNLAVKSNLKKYPYASTDKIPKRKYLGSSFKPRQKAPREVDTRDLITLEDALDFMASGCPREDIVECFRFDGFALEDLVLKPQEEKTLDPPIGTYSLARPLENALHLKTESDVKEAISRMYQLLDKKLKAKDVCAVYEIDSHLRKSIPAWIAWERMHTRESKAEVRDELYLELIGDVASLLGSPRTQELFGLPTWQKAAAQLGVRNKRQNNLEVAFVDGSNILYRGPIQTRRRLSVFSRQYHGIDNIPPEKLEQFGIKAYQIQPGRIIELV
jgi:hypothetical protein